jgi:uncharacterized membrane protein YphA (DoxX/SURF4 family)
VSDATEQSRALSFLRIAVGVFFLVFAEYKLADMHFIRSGMATYIQGFVDHGSYPFMQPLLKDLILAHAVFFGAVVSVTELMIGLSLVTGILVRWASLGGLVMMLLFLFSADYPGAHAAPWKYFGASLDHSVFALAFVTLILAGPPRIWVLRLRRSAL